MVQLGDRSALVCCVVACILSLSTHAHAQSPPDPAPPPAPGPVSPAQPTPPPPTTSPDPGARPWAAGVSDAEQAAALELHIAGNREFTESRFAQALAKYKEAIQHWDHPAIRFNMAVCLINLDQLVEARDNIERSLAYGATALDGDKYALGLTDRKLLDAQLAHVKITCPERGAEVTLDGKFLFTGPGAMDQFLLPGKHQMVATKTGFLTASRTFDAAPGTRTVYEIRPSLGAATPETARWGYWKYLVVGGGGLIAAGATSYLLARNDFASYDHAVATRCPDGCSAAELRGALDLQTRKGRAEVEQVLAFTAFSIGGAAIVAAAVGLIVDQPRARRDPDRAHPVVTAAPGSATVSMSWGF